MLSEWSSVEHTDRGPVTRGRSPIARDCALRFAIVAATLCLTACAGPLAALSLSPVTPKGDALLVLPGFGYGRTGRNAMRSLTASMVSERVDLYVPTYVTRSGLATSRAKLHRFIRENRFYRYERVHVFAFIAGAWTLNPLVERQALPNLATVIVAIRTACAGDTERYLERTATTQWGLVICIYFVSYVPALRMLRIPATGNENVKLMFFLVVVTQLSDVLQYVWGKSLGRRPVAPSISPNKTWAGLVGGIGSATAIGTAIWWATPFRPAQAAVMALVVTVLGFAGGLIMSAIKRDRGIKDYGSLIEGHGGVLDRIDSLCFAAPVFFHLTRFFFVP